jgi:thioredoxin
MKLLLKVENSPMSNLIKVSNATFESEVLNSDLPVVVDFYADWCPPCRMLGPILERLSQEFAGKIKFVKINSDEENALSASFKVTGLPTVMFMDDGRNVGQFAGLPEESALREELNKWLRTKSAV